MKIKRMAIADIGEAEYNPRQTLQPGQPEYEAIKKSLETFGLVEPLIFNEQTGNLVGGHQRLGVLKRGGATEVDVSIVDLDPDQEKALNLALNKIDGAWDQGALEKLILDLTAAGQEIVGFDQQELDDVLLKLSMEEAEAAESRVPEEFMTQIERPDQGDQRIKITLRGPVELFTEGACAELRKTWSLQGAEVKIEREDAT